MTENVVKREDNVPEFLFVRDKKDLEEKLKARLKRDRLKRLMEVQEIEEEDKKEDDQKVDRLAEEIRRILSQEYDRQREADRLAKEIHTVLSRYSMSRKDEYLLECYFHNKEWVVRALVQERKRSPHAD